MVTRVAAVFLHGLLVAAGEPTLGPRAALVLSLVTAWALRLSVYITWRNWDQGEDRRYQAIRARNEPNFAAKSLFLVFGLQAVLAWIISLPLRCWRGSYPCLCWARS
jgi:steroid 5-alpha reductase family enzyme